MIATRRNLLTLTAATAAAPAIGQTPWVPERPVTFLGPFAAGGAFDLTARALARGMEPLLGQPIAVLNRTGAGGTIMLAELARARPDGLTIGLLSVNTNAIAPQLNQVSFDPVHDFSPILTYGSFTTFVAVPRNSPIAGLREMMARARAAPGSLNVGVSAIGSNAHLTMARLAAQESAEVTFVPFAGGAPAVAALLGGHVDCAVVSGEILPSVRDGTLRLLAVLNAQRAAEFPDVPTLLDLDYGWAANPWVGVGGPKGLPEPIVSRYGEIMRRATETEGFRSTMATLAIAPVSLGPAETAALMAQSFAEHAEIARRLRIGRFAQP